MLSINQPSANLTAIDRINKKREDEEEKLASGKRINSAADDAAGLQIANRLTKQINQSQQLSFNAQDQANINNIEAGALSAIDEALQRANELSVQSGNPINDNGAIQGELDQITEQINTIASELLGQNNFISGLDASDPASTQTILQDATTVINDNATSLGAESNALISRVATYQTSVVNVSASRSRIEDTDYSATTSEKEETKILLQATLINKKNEEDNKGLLFNKLV